MLRRDTQCRGVFVHDGCVSIYVTHGKSQNACGIFCWHLQIDRCQTVECCGLARQRKASVYTAQRGRLLYCIRLRRTHPRPIVKPPTSRSIIVLNAVTRMSHVEGQRRSVVHQLLSFLCIAKLSVVHLRRAVIFVSLLMERASMFTRILSLSLCCSTGKRAPASVHSRLR